MTARQVIFRGRVQGVGFRYHTKQTALGFDLVGWVKNKPDGSVELQVMGEEEEVSEFIQEIACESELASLIKEYDVREIDPLENCQGFRIAGI